MKLKVLEGALKERLLTALRDERSDTATFKRAAHQLSKLLIGEALKELKLKPIPIKTPVARGTGYEAAQEVVFVPILRAGLAALPAAVELYPEGRIGFLGMKRDEETLKPFTYYAKVPAVKGARYLILDPMLATGGTAEAAVKFLKGLNVPEEEITFVATVAAPKGLSRLKEFSITVVTAAVDEKLNPQGYIVPGLGDAGDRFCGTDGVEVIESYGV